MIDLEPDQVQLLNKVLHTLPERERVIIEMRFFQEMTVKAISNHFQVSTDRIRSLVARSLRKLRHPSRLNLLEECCI